jgi:hypothetical protein
VSKVSIPSARHGVLFEVSDTGQFLGYIMPSRLRPLNSLALTAPELLGSLSLLEATQTVERWHSS